MKTTHLILAGLLGATLSLSAGVARAEDHVEWNPLTQQALGPGDKRFFNMEYTATWAGDALGQLGAGRPAGATRGDYAQAVLKVLQDKVPATNRSVALAQPPVPDWLLEGYSRFQPRSVAKSRWLNDIVAARQGQPQVNPKVQPDADIAALYAYWCLYDAEWFNVARKPDFKAWLTAVQLSYPGAWQRLNREDETSLHYRLVAPLQTKDEPYREIDNWVGALKREEGGFAKPLVRRALVEELLQRGGYNPPDKNGKVQPIDPRLFEDPAYKGAVPAGLGLTEQQFFLLAALCVEFSGEVNMLAPDAPQLRPFADYFIQAFERQ